MTSNLPCCAVPNVLCFGQPCEWRFGVNSDLPNWRRDLDRHEALHAKYKNEQVELLRQSKNIELVSRSAWKCRRCNQSLATLGKALRHTCNPKRARAASMPLPSFGPKKARGRAARGEPAPYNLMKDVKIVGDLDLDACLPAAPLDRVCRYFGQIRYQL